MSPYIPLVYLLKSKLLANFSHQPTIGKHIQWVQRHSITIDMEIWKSVHEEQILKKGKYAHHFINAINVLPNIPCVLRSNGYNISKGKFVIRFECSHPKCDRTYKVRQILDNNFTVSDNNVEYCHVDKRTRQARGSEREAFKKSY